MIDRANPARWIEDSHSHPVPKDPRRHEPMMPGRVMPLIEDANDETEIDLREDETK
jgi:hypothetical protein